MFEPSKCFHASNSKCRNQAVKLEKLFSYKTEPLKYSVAQKLRPSKKNLDLVYHRRVFLKLDVLRS